MSTSKFLLLLLGTIASLTGIMLILSLNEKMSENIDIAYYAIPAFSILCISVFFLTEYLEKQPNKSMLLNVVIMNVIFKFLVAIGVVVIYHKHKQPEDGIFVLPFIIIYVVFTIFETYFMSLQAKSK